MGDMKKQDAPAFSFLNRARPLTLREVLRLRDGLKRDRGSLKQERGYFFYPQLAERIGKAGVLLSLN